ncbi:MAG: hypothetical protein MJY89_00440 [Bacteroidales bacterium]|nr:hypothetical protein [Bacteroidales bacterium]
MLFLAAVPGYSQEFDSEKAVSELKANGYMNVRCVEDSSSVVLTLENDTYKIPASGFSNAVRVLESQGLPKGKKVEVIGMYYGVPQLTMQYQSEVDRWTVTSRIKSWNKVKGERPSNSSFGRVDLVFYPQISMMNLIITQVYQSLWQISPALELSLWRGAKLSYQVKVPLFNDGYKDSENFIHPGMVTFSQRFRDPWNLNIYGRLSVGAFNSSRFGAALDLKYVFPNERFSVDGQLACLAICYWDSNWVLHFDKTFHTLWYLSANYYWPQQKTQFTLRAQQFVLGELGLKAEVIRHFRHCSIGGYLEKAESAQANAGFRFQVALPPYRHPRRGHIPRITTSGQMGLVYNANNEQYFYKEFKPEASDNIMEANYFNPFYVQSEIQAMRRKK